MAKASKPATTAVVEETHSRKRGNFTKTDLVTAVVAEIKAGRDKETGMNNVVEKLGGNAATLYGNFRKFKPEIEKLLGAKLPDFPTQRGYQMGDDEDKLAALRALVEAGDNDKEE